MEGGEQLVSYFYHPNSFQCISGEDFTTADKGGDQTGWSVDVCGVEISHRCHYL